MPNDLPPLPPGFTLDNSQDRRVRRPITTGELPPLPPGFALDRGAVVSAQPQQEVPQMSAMGTAADVAKSFGSGIARGAAYMVGLPGDVNDLVGRGIGAARDYFIGDVTPEQREQINAARNQANILPTSEGVMSAAHGITGMSLHQPETTAGEYARTVGEFAPAALAPGGVIARSARVLLPALGSEAAGQVTEGTPLEPYARVGGAVVGGLATAGRSSVKSAAKGAPTANQIRSQTDQLYTKLRNAGIKYDPRAFQSSVVRAESKLIDKGWRRSNAGPVFDYLDDLKQQSGRTDFSDIDGIMQAVGTEARGAATPSLQRAWGVLRDELHTFERLSPIAPGATVPRSQVNALVKQARQTALKNIKQRALNEIIEKADTYQAGIESGIRTGIGNLLRSKYGRRLFKGAERQALLDVAQGRKALQQLSKFGFDLTSLNGNAAFLPAVGTAAAYAVNPIAGAVVPAAGTAAKIASPLMTKRAFERAQAAIRSGALANSPRVTRNFTPIQSGATTGLLELQRQQTPR